MAPIGRENTSIGAPGAGGGAGHAPPFLRAMLGAAGWVLVLAVLFRLLAVGFAPGLLRFSDETTGALQDAMHLEDAKGWLRLDKCDWQRGIRGGLTRTFQRAALEVSGYRPGSLLALSIIQGSLVAVLLLLLGWLAVGRGVGLVAGGLGAAMPVMLGASLWPEATSTAVFIFLLGLTLLVAALRGEEPTRVRAVSALLGGLVVGAAVLARFEFGLLALFVGLFNPFWATACATIYCIGRIKYGIDYSTNGPDARRIGGNRRNARRAGVCHRPKPNTR